MRALKTIVATAVIVFALTTVAMAGVQRLGGAGSPAPQAAAATTQTAAQPAVQGDVTLSAQQFAALLSAVRRDGDGTRDGNATRTHTKARTHAHARQQDHAQATHGSTNAMTSSTSHHTTTHDGTTHHTTTNRSGTQHGDTHSGTHDGGMQGGGHDGGAGCD